MNLDTLSAAYSRVRQAHDQGLPDMTLGTLAVQTRTLSDPATAWDAFKAEGPQEAWLQFQSRVETFRGGALPKPEPDWGYLLAAEGVDGAGRSLQVRPGSDGTLLLVVATPGGPGAEPFLTDKVYHLAARPGLGSLSYCRYWRQDLEMGPVPAFAAFLGFTCTEDARHAPA